MADFVADGFLRFDELVPKELNETAHKAMEDRTVQGGSAGLAFSQICILTFNFFIFLMIHRVKWVEL